MASLAKKIDELLARHTKIRAFVVVLKKDSPATYELVTDYVGKMELKKIPFTLPAADLSYFKLAEEATHTVMWYEKRVVLGNSAFRDGELTEEQVAELLKQMTIAFKLEAK